jgi:hypothetical protein
MTCIPVIGRHSSRVAAQPRSRSTCRSRAIARLPPQCHVTLMPMLLIVSETKHGGRFRATLADGTPLLTSRIPLLDAARILLRRGVDPQTRLTMRHAGSTTNALTSTVATAAGITVQVSHSGKPIFARHQTGGESTSAAPPRPQIERRAPRQPPAHVLGSLRGDPTQPPDFAVEIDAAA